MSKLMTVRGPAEASVLGHFQMHEHIFVHATPASQANPALKIDDEARSLVDMTAYRAAGGGTLLDAQPLEAGRNLAALARLSRESGVNVVAVTGYHLPAFYPEGHWIFTGSPQLLRERFCRELAEGVDTEEGRVRPGAVKAAIGADGPAGRFADCLWAAAAAAAWAEVPLILHTERGRGAVEAVKLCERAGLSPARVAVCHADRQAEDLRPHEEIARTGAFLEYDTIARGRYHDDAAEARLICHMLDRGYEERLLLSLDTTAARLRGYEPAAPGLDYLLREFLPYLGAAGVPCETIRGMMVNNPLRIFGIYE